MVAVIGGRGFWVRTADVTNLHAYCEGGVYVPELLAQSILPAQEATGEEGALRKFVGTSAEL